MTMITPSSKLTLTKGNKSWSSTTFVEVLLALKNLPHLPLNLKHKMNAIVVVNLFIAAYNGYK